MFDDDDEGRTEGERPSRAGLTENRTLDGNEVEMASGENHMLDDESGVERMSVRG